MWLALPGVFVAQRFNHLKSFKNVWGTLTVCYFTLLILFIVHMCVPWNAADGQQVSCMRSEAKSQDMVSSMPYAGPQELK